MVGVPGRSRGCMTCKRRKKRCDLQKPLCANCVKGKYECGGYQKDVIVVQVNAEGKGSYKPFPKAASLTSVCSKELNRGAVEVGIFDAFWGIYFPRAAFVHRPEKLPRSLDEATRWAKWIQRAVPGSDLLRCGLLALSVSQLGQSKQNAAMIQQGMELYGKTLARFARDLNTPSKIAAAETAATCRILALYELNGNLLSSGNWLRHTAGLSKLIQFRSPDSFAVPGDHEMFMEARYDLVTVALTTRKSSFLSLPDWKSRPWKGVQRNVLDKIVDILLVFSELFEEFDMISSESPTRDALHRASILKDQCSRLDSQLQNWYRDFIIMLGPLLDSYDMQYMHNGEENEPRDDLPEILAKHSLVILYALVLYWTACLILVEFRYDLFYRFPSAKNDAMGPLGLERAKSLSYSYCICRSAKFLLHPDAGFSMAASMVFPIAMVRVRVENGAMLHMSPNDDTRRKKLEEINSVLKQSKPTSVEVCMNTRHRTAPDQV